MASTRLLNSTARNNRAGLERLRDRLDEAITAIYELQIEGERLWGLPSSDNTSFDHRVDEAEHSLADMRRSITASLNKATKEGTK